MNQPSDTHVHTHNNTTNEHTYECTQTYVYVHVHMHSHSHTHLLPLRQLPARAALPWPARSSPHESTPPLFLALACPKWPADMCACVFVYVYVCVSEYVRVCVCFWVHVCSNMCGGRGMSTSKGVFQQSNAQGGPCKRAFPKLFFQDLLLNIFSRTASNHSPRNDGLLQ